MALFALRGLLHCAFDGGSFGDVSIGTLFELVSHLVEVPQGLKDIRLTRDIGPGECLTGPVPCAPSANVESGRKPYVVKSNR